METKIVDLTGNTYRNWHKPSKWYRTNKPALSDSFPLTANRHANTGVNVSFQNDAGKQISFILTRESAEFLRDKINKALSEIPKPL